MNRRDTEARSFQTEHTRAYGERQFVTIRSVILCGSVALWCILVGACSVPNLEKPECTESREAIKQFYSYHFGNDMRPSEENVRLREKYLTPNFGKKLLVDVTGVPETNKDYFTQTEDFPKAFRIGSCESVSPQKTIFQVLLLWHDDQKNTQREVKVEMVKQEDKWLVNEVIGQ